MTLTLAVWLAISCLSVFMLSFICCNTATSAPPPPAPPPPVPGCCCWLALCEACSLRKLVLRCVSETDAYISRTILTKSFCWFIMWLTSSRLNVSITCCCWAGGSPLPLAVGCWLLDDNRVNMRSCLPIISAILLSSERNDWCIEFWTPSICLFLK